MWHGRKSCPFLFHGHKGHVLRDLDTGSIVAIQIIQAEVPEARTTSKSPVT